MRPLGRIPSPPDERDYQLRNFLGLGAPRYAPADAVALIEAGVAALKETEVSYRRWARTVYPNPQLTHWWNALDLLAAAEQVIKGDTPTPPPSPAPAGYVSWTDAEPVLDQGNYGTCVGNGCAQWGNTLPIDDRFTEKDARKIYYEATVLDGSPDDPDAPGGGQQGATVRSGVKAMQARGRLKAYAFASTTDEIVQFVSTQGPLIVGTDWMNDMFQPDEDGLVAPTGEVAGGHCYLLCGFDPDREEFEFLNSWGDGWGVRGHFYMRIPDFGKLLSEQGEAVAAVELPV